MENIDQIITVMKGLSPWALNSMAQFKSGSSDISSRQSGTLAFKIFKTTDSIWISVSNRTYPPIYFRACFVPGGGITGIKTKEKNGETNIQIDSVIGRFDTRISFIDGSHSIIKYTCSLKVHSSLFVPFWPRDILTVADPSQGQKEMGEIHNRQIGTRSGMLFLSFPQREVRVMYFQNLTALSPFCEQSGTSLREAVGGQLPEIGLALPAAIEVPLKGGTEVILSDARVCIKVGSTKTETLSMDYLDMLTDIYLEIPKPKTTYLHWPEILKKGLKDLIESPGCWSQLDGNHYFNAYVCDYETPPEIMVQLAVLLPLLDYVEWSGQELEVMKTIKKGLTPFYDKKLKTIVRWHPAAKAKLKGDEEQKTPGVMDSWYLHHPLLNLSRLALKGDKVAEKLFLDSLSFAIRVAHKFKYEWPVFYKMDTLEIIKFEIKPGEGGEGDVPGLYAHVMLQAYELTKQEKFLIEAETAARKLETKGFKIMYQANNTAFSAGALLRLYKITGKELYLDLSYRCLASVFQNVQLWDCNYGFGKNLPTFFALFPLTEAPYTAVYEEQEVFCALHDYLNHAQGIEIAASVRLLCCEYIRYLVDRAPYYYPPMLPEEMLSKEVKMGEVDRRLWIALEDLHDGTEQSGSIGQEVYGAGNAFGILPRHYIRVEHEKFLIYCDCPFSTIRRSADSVSFVLQGDSRIQTRIRIVPEGGDQLDDSYRFSLENSAFKSAHERKGYLDAFMAADQKVKISWKMVNL